jgi:hypothetical protein
MTMSTSESDEDDLTAEELGWEVPIAGRIPVALSGLEDADWELTEDERQS